MALKEADQHNFDTLLRAAANNDLVLVQSKDKETGEYRALLCAKWQDGDLTCLTPLAQMVTGNPFEQYVDPTTCMEDDKHDVH